MSFLDHRVDIHPVCVSGFVWHIMCHCVIWYGRNISPKMLNCLLLARDCPLFLWRYNSNPVKNNETNSRGDWKRTLVPEYTLPLSISWLISIHRKRWKAKNRSANITSEWNMKILIDRTRNSGSKKTTVIITNANKSTKRHHRNRKNLTTCVLNVYID